MKNAVCQWVGMVLMAVALAGCAATKTYTLEEAPEMVVVTDFAPFYSMGPMQGRGPDASLRADSRVRLLRQEFGYSFVRLENDREGYVPNEALLPAPPRPPVKENQTAASRGSSSGSRRGDFLPDPVFDDTALPDVPSMNEIPLEVPPPILLDDEGPVKPPSFRL